MRAITLDRSPADPDATVVPIEARSFTYSPRKFTVPANQPFAITLKETDAVHDFVVEGIDGYVIADAGESATGGFVASERGEYTYYCSIGGHRQAGMEGVIVVE